jgi:hypothetical protein
VNTPSCALRDCITSHPFPCWISWYTERIEHIG